MTEFFLIFQYPDQDPLRIKITEPVGYDAYAYKLKQGANRYGRDKVIGADEIGITFWNLTGEEINPPQINSYGQAVYYAGHCFERLLDIGRASRQGFEAIVYFVPSLNGVDAPLAQIDFPKWKTDETTYITVNVIQDTKRAIIERRADIDVDVFGSVDLDGNAVTPLVPTRYLMKAKPTVDISKLSTPVDNPINTNLISYGSDGYIFNPQLQIEQDDIENTFNPFLPISYLPQGYGNPEVLDALDGFKLLVAVEELTNVTVNIHHLRLFIADGVGTPTSKNFVLIWGSSPFEGVRQGKYEFVAETTDDVDIVDEEFTYTIPKVFRGHTVWLYAQAIVQSAIPSPTPIQNTTVEMRYDVDVIATSTAIDSVIDALSLPRFLEAGVLRIGQLPLTQPILEAGGKYENLFVFNGNMLRNKKAPFNFQFNEHFKDDLRVLGNSDCQINQTGVEIGTYEDFYPNIDLGSFDLSAPLDIEKSFNPRFQLKSLDIEFSKYEKDDRAVNTTDSFHTKSQYAFPNRGVDNSINLIIKKIYDPFKIERDRILSLRETTALESDNDTYLVDSIELAPGTVGGFTAYLTQLYQGGVIYLYNKSVSPDSDAPPPVFKWTQLGIKVGDIFTYSATGFIVPADHIILEITDSIIKLSPIGYSPIQIGNDTFTVSYVFTDVLWTNRTFQGFDFIENLQSGNNCSNIRLSIAHLMEDFYSYFNTVCSAYPNGKLRNTSFVNNAALRTQYNGGRILQEGNTLLNPTAGDILVSEMDDKILSVDQYKTQVSCSFEQATSLFDTGLKGFIRVQNALGRVVKLHLADCAMVWRDEILEIARGEVRNEADVTTIDSQVGGGVLINQTGYLPDQLAIDWFSITNDVLRIYDNRSRLVISPVRYQEVLVNGVSYDTVEEFTGALLLVI